MRKAQLSLSVSAARGWTVLTAQGEIDLSTAPVLRGRLEELLADRAERVLVDLEPVEFMDSSGLAALLEAVRRWSERGYELAVLAPSGPVRKLLSVSGVEKVIPVYKSIEQLTDGTAP